MNHPLVFMLHWGKAMRYLSLLAVMTLVFGMVAGAGVQAQVLNSEPPRPVPDSARRNQASSSPGINPATAAQLAQAMEVPSGDLVAADLMGSDANGVGVGDAALGKWFPTSGGTFAILSTGLAADADNPNNEEDLSWELGGISNAQGEDLVRLHLELVVPSGRNCLGFDFIFYSEEFFEFVGSPFNDAFTVQLNNSFLDIVGTTVIAPGNFVIDPNGDFITVNAAYLATGSTGTTYDGATPQLKVTTPVTPGSTIHLYFSIQDLADSVYDSTVFLDNFAWTNDPGCESGVISITFLDVPTSYWAWRFIEALAAAGLTVGYPDGTYRPENPVTRGEMAVFLKKGIHGSSYVSPAPTGSTPFTDISGHWAESWIEDLWEEGMTSGYPDSTYRPENQVTRAEMAIFLLKAKYGSSYIPPAPSGGSFTDVNGHWAEAWIEQLKEEGVTSGYPDGSYRPENNVTRAEMAVFLVNNFSIPIP